MKLQTDNQTSYRWPFFNTFNDMSKVVESQGGPRGYPTKFLNDLLYILHLRLLN